MVESKMSNNSDASEMAAVVPDDNFEDPVVEEASEGGDASHKDVPILSGNDFKYHSIADPRERFSAVADFYAGKGVLVTGGSGFLGKVLVEKILRSCPDIREVFLLLRNGRKGESPEQRVKKLISESPFSDLESKYPGVVNKVQAIAGDVSAPDLGISPADRRRLAESVSVVFHSAAKITFNAPITDAIETNLQGTRRVIQLCKDIPKLQCLVYVSTAFCNCNVKGKIEERVLEAPCDPEWLIKTVEEMDPVKLQKNTKSLLFGHPNTYTLTKLLAETSIKNERGTIPTAIVRPSIVMGALEEPTPGWVDNANGASSFLAGALYGVFRGILASDDVVADLVPSDLVVNQIITAAWDVCQRKPENSEDETENGPLTVYHCTSGQVNPITWGEYTSMAIDLARENPCKGILWYPAGRCRRSPIRNTAAAALLHTFPARMVEMMSKIKGDNAGSRLVRLQGIYNKGMQHTRFFTTRQWSFECANSSSLNNKLNNEDKAIFPSDPSAISWPDYLERCILGLRQFYFKQRPESLPEARKSVKKLRRIYWSVQTFLFLLAVAFGVWATGSLGMKAFIIGAALIVVMRAL